MNLIPHFINKKNLSWKVDLIEPYLHNGEKILDFGCGDLSFASALKKKKKSIHITGVDVIDFHVESEIPYKVYDGKKLPFPDKSFDTVIAFYVLHHCENREESLKECMRVAKRLIIVEPVSRINFEKYLMGTIDWLFNVVKLVNIPITTRFSPLSFWEEKFREFKVKKYTFYPTSNFFSFLPVGKTYIFEVKT